MFDNSFARALRRHHAARLKAKRAHYWGGSDKTPRLLGLLSQTPALCSCPGCGNPRKYFGELSIFEQRELQHSVAELLADTCD